MGVTVGKPALFGIVLILAASATGCTLLDRESYSIMIRKRAHYYQSADARKDSGVEEPVAATSDPGSEAPRDLPPVLQPFRPFAYCLRHRSSHILESILAVGISPVEFPLALISGGPVALVVTGNIKFGGPVERPGADPVIEMDPIAPPAK